MKNNNDILYKNIIKKYIDKPEFRQMKNYCAHGKVSVFSHSVNVSKMAYSIDKFFNLKSDLNVLIPGALLHDFYLYDWHNRPLSKKIFEMHGFTHPEEARKNAVKYYEANERIQEVIKCHMWPLTFRSLPRHKEAIIVCLADKLCAIKETIERW